MTAALLGQTIVYAVILTAALFGVLAGVRRVHEAWREGEPTEADDAEL